MLHSYYKLLSVAPLCLPVLCTARTVFDLVCCEASGTPVLPRTATALGRNKVTDFNRLCCWSTSGVT